MSLLGAFWRLDARRRRLIAEAGALLLLVAAGLRLTSYARLHKALSTLASRTQRLRRSSLAGPFGPAEDHANVAWAISAAARRLPIKTTCLIEALASDTMLRRRRHESRLRFGVRRDRGDSPLAAHAWVECEGDLVVGVMDNLDDYATLTSLGGREVTGS